MKIILTSDVDGIGTKGDVVDVAAGYGRNFLLPKRLGVKATDGALAQAEGIRTARAEAETREITSAGAVKLQLAGTRIVIAAQAGDEGKLFGSIGVAEIIAAVKNLSNVELERSTVQLAEPVKSIGLHEVTVQLHKKVSFPLTVDVIPA
jgi:large subunit ribosomal protein L9